MKFDTLTKKMLIDKYFKKQKMELIFTILMENIDNIDMYVALTYQIKDKTFRINWCDLTIMENKNIATWLNSNLIFPKKVEELKRIIAVNGISEIYDDPDDIDSNVTITSYITNYEANQKIFNFKRYLPSCWHFLSEALLIVFDNMPRICFSFYQIMLEKIVSPEPNYIFNFDLKHDNINKLFNKDTIAIGTSYYNDAKVIKIENVNNTTYALVRGTKDYLTSIVYNDSTKELQLGCTCGCKTFCKHEYAALLAMKSKQEIRYYKISYKDESKTLLDRLRSFEYFLCLGIIDNYFLVIKNYGISALPILDKDKKFNWEIIEDDDTKSLEKAVNDYLENNK